jgi:hypothetical protein
MLYRMMEKLATIRIIYSQPLQKTQPTAMKPFKLILALKFMTKPKVIL